MPQIAFFQCDMWTETINNQMFVRKRMFFSQTHGSDLSQWTDLIETRPSTPCAGTISPSPFCKLDMFANWVQLNPITTSKYIG